MNKTLKDRIAKTRKCSGWKWPDALNLVLWDIRNTPRRPTGLTPAEMLFGRHLAIPGTYIPAKISLVEGDERLTQYVISMHQYFKQNQKMAMWSQPVPTKIQVRGIQPGD